MRRRRLLTIIITAVLSTRLLVAPVMALAACPDNILDNGGFEAGFDYDNANGLVTGKGWHPFYQDGPDQEFGLNQRPEYAAESPKLGEPRRIREGAFAQKWSTAYATHHAGIYQQVSVSSGSGLRLTAWALAWSSSGDDRSVSEGGAYALSVGIDPTGGTDWTSPNVIWSAPDPTLDEWVQLSVEATAASDNVTVYLRGDAQWPLRHNQAYFDEVCLTPLAHPVPTAGSTATATPSSEPPSATVEPSPSPAPSSGSGETIVHIVEEGEYLGLIAERYGVSMYDIAEANGIGLDDIISIGQRLVIPGGATPEPTATPTATGGTIAVAAFSDDNGNGLQDQGERFLAKARIVISRADGKIMGEYVTNGKSEPHTFGPFAAGEYIIKEEDPPGYISAHPNEWTISLTEGSEFHIHFADRPEAAETPSPSRTSTTPLANQGETAPPVADASAGDGGSWPYSGIVVALVALALPFAHRLARRYL